MSIILTEIDQALATHDACRGRPVAIYLGERKLTSRLHVKGLPEREDVDIVNAGFLFGNDPPGVRAAPPRLGEHSQEILEGLGFTGEELATLNKHLQ